MPDDDMPKKTSLTIGLVMVQIWCCLSAVILLIEVQAITSSLVVEVCTLSIVSIILGVCGWHMLSRRLRLFSLAAVLVSTLQIVLCLQYSGSLHRT
jgi:hypothetical protein